MRKLVSTLMSQQARIFELCGDDRRPRARVAVGAPVLAALDSFFAAHGGACPPSYRAFLKVCDGIEDFSFSYHLFGAQDLLSLSYPETSARALGAEADPSCLPDEGRVLIGSHLETTTTLVIDFLHEQLERDEFVVLDGSPGNVSLHLSFLAFMRMRIAANEITIAKLIDVRDGRIDEE